MINVYSFSLIFSVFFVLSVLELVRKNKLQERYSLFWILMGTTLLTFAVFPSLVDTLAVWLGIKEHPFVLLLIGLIFLIIYALHLTTVVSSQSEKITKLAQELALFKLRKMKESPDNERGSFKG
ncbi:MAG: DUF2304 domain-containing protein [Eubacteriales bacterium]|nr:DUF2304 domain-containing protein [Eubacteriales bacterium]